MVQHGEKVHVLHHHCTATVENICWLAPEVLAQDLEGYSSKSDVYSVGIAALELATGEAPFAGLPVTEVRVRVHVCVHLRVCVLHVHVCVCVCVCIHACMCVWRVRVCVWFVCLHVCAW